MLETMHHRKIITGFILCALILPTAVFAADEDLNILRRTAQAFTKVAQNAVPAVVAVQSEYVIASQSYRSPLEDDFFEFFFGPRYRRHSEPQRHIGQGSGFIVSEDGFILTNNHVVAGADKITVLLNDGSKYEDVEVVGTDDKADVALLKIKDVENLPTVNLGNSDNLQIGEWVIAVGNPFGLTETVTVGVVSAMGRKLHAEGSDVYEDYIQTDAAINPGNSGGPLLNIDGEVVGINAAIVSGDRGYMGIGLAVPINMAKSIKDQLIETGKVVRGYAGLDLQDLTEDIAKALDLKIRRGAIVTGIEENSPAAEAGLQERDIITEINGRRIESSQDARNIIDFATPGSQLQIAIDRDGREKKLKVITAARPVSEELIDTLGIRIKNNPDGEGIVITEVKNGTEAAQAGLRPDMIITSINRIRINSVRQFMDVLKQAQEQGAARVALFVQSNRFTYYVVLPLGR